VGALRGGGALDVSEAAAAFHLRVLTKAGLVTKPVRGREAIYRWQFVLERPPARTMGTLQGEAL
jgi:DNA-binding transcriptional ArsR family regulator